MPQAFAERPSLLLAMHLSLLILSNSEHYFLLLSFSKHQLIGHMGPFSLNYQQTRWGYGASSQV